jgi:uncharacterized protein YkwD
VRLFLLARTTAPALIAVAAAGCPKVDSTPGASPTAEDPRRDRTESNREPTPAGEQGKLEGLTDAHNAVRKKVGVPPLRWSRSLARHAQSWADRLAAQDCALKHRPSDKYGENLFWSSQPATASEVVAEWGSEAAGYDHRTNRCKATCGHYTQVVWSSTKIVGCGVASCGGGDVWVCNYDPPGNIVGRKPY